MSNDYIYGAFDNVIYDNATYGATTANDELLGFDGASSGNDVIVG